MKEWGFIGQEILVGIGKSATINIFKNGVALRKIAKIVLSNPHSS
jgi:hypothetical protein